MKSLDLLKHPLLSRTLDWDSLLEKISWEGWYETPLWMKWQKKQTGVANDYQCLHDIYDFESPQFRRIMEIVMSAEPETITNAQLALKIQGLQEKVIIIIIIIIIFIIDEHSSFFIMHLKCLNCVSIRNVIYIRLRPYATFIVTNAEFTPICSGLKSTMQLKEV